jgi:hypothetical protein
VIRSWPRPAPSGSTIRWERSALVAQLVALIQGDAHPQAQSVSNTLDPTVTGQPVTDGSLTAIGSAVAANGPFGTDLQVQTADADGMRNGQLMVRVNRILHSGDGAATVGEPGQPCLSATWRLPDGTPVRSIFATAQTRKISRSSRNGECRPHDRPPCAYPTARTSPEPILEEVLCTRAWVCLEGR